MNSRRNSIKNIIYELVLLRIKTILKQRRHINQAIGVAVYQFSNAVDIL